MPDDGANGGGDVKVVDRRRFTAEGEARDAPEALVAPPDERDARLAAAEARSDELLRAYAAEVEQGKAFRARLERERQRVLEAERAQIAQALLDSLDELERALSAAGAPEPGTPLAALVDGVRLTVAGLAKRVAEMGAERLSLVGQPFDPRLAEAVDLVPVGEADRDQIVVSEERPGYRIGDRVLRPARVRVGRFVRA
jgi:molecular chaperone GrpE